MPNINVAEETYKLIHTVPEGQAFTARDIATTKPNLSTKAVSAACSMPHFKGKLRHIGENTRGGFIYIKTQSFATFAHTWRPKGNNSKRRRRTKAELQQTSNEQTETSQRNASARRSIVATNSNHDALAETFLAIAIAAERNDLTRALLWQTIEQILSALKAQERI